MWQLEKILSAITWCRRGTHFARAPKIWKGRKPLSESSYQANLNSKLARHQVDLITSLTTETD